MQLLILSLSGILSYFLPADTTAYELLVGSYTKEGNPGIEVYDLRPPVHASSPRYTLDVPNGSFIAVSADQELMYAVREQGGGNSAVAAFRRRPDGRYEALNTSLTGGDGPCHVAFREGSSTVYAANYGSGSLSVFRTTAGRLEPVAQHIRYKGSGPVKGRQEAPHAHQVTISPDQHHLYVTDLGSDRIYQHRIYSDGLVDEQPQIIQVEPGSGPRHMLFNGAGDRAYVINELSGKVSVFAVSKGAFTLLQSVVADTSAAAPKASADIHLSPNGKWLISSNRITSEQLTVFAVQADGTLRKAAHQQVGKRPRNFNFTPDGRHVYVASQEENRIQVFSFDDATGALTDQGRDIRVKMPVCLVFLKPGQPVDPEERIRTQNIQLIPPTSPIANYVKFVHTGNLVFLSGHGPDKPGGSQVFGKVGKDLTMEEGQAAARLTGISLLSTLRGYLGDLNRVKRVVKVTGLVNCVDGFTQQPAVMNGFSNLMVEVFGDRGRHARTSVGVNALPNNIPVEIEMIVELKQ